MKYVIREKVVYDDIPYLGNRHDIMSTLSFTDYKGAWRFDSIEDAEGELRKDCIVMEEDEAEAIEIANMLRGIKFEIQF